MLKKLALSLTFVCCFYVSSAVSDTIELDVSGDGLCTAADEFIVFDVPDIGTMQSIEVFVDLPCELFQSTCQVAVSNGDVVSNMTFQSGAPGVWTTDGPNAVNPADLSSAVLTAYPDAAAWRVQETDFTFSTPWSPVSLGTFDFEVAEAGTLYILLDVPFSSYVTATGFVIGGYMDGGDSFCPAFDFGPTGACDANGDCIVSTQQGCESLQGTSYQGDGSVCPPSIPPCNIGLTYALDIDSDPFDNDLDLDTTSLNNKVIVDAWIGEDVIDISGFHLEVANFPSALVFDSLTYSAPGAWTLETPTVGAFNQLSFGAYDSGLTTFLTLPAKVATLYYTVTTDTTTALLSADFTASNWTDAGGNEGDFTANENVQWNIVPSSATQETSWGAVKQLFR